MESIQINGQKIWGPPRGWVGSPPPHGTEIFIKNIPDDVFEDELFYLFSRVGRVYEVRLPVYWTGMNKGYAFVRYTTIAEADAAIKNLNLNMIRQGRQIRVERSLDNTRLFLSSVPNEKTGEDIKSDLLTVVENVEAVYVYPALENPAMFRGYAFVEFVCHRDAAIAKRILTPDVLFNLFERKCVAAWAKPLPFLSKETLRNINTLFMRNIPSNAKSISIRVAVDSVISPDSVHKLKRLSNCAFFTFKNHEMADRAMLKIKSNPYLLGKKAVVVEWAIPRDLANTFSSKDLEAGKDDESELNFEPNVENPDSLLKIRNGYENNHPEIFVENFNDVNNWDVENTENIPFGLPSPSNIRVLQRTSSDLSSSKPSPDPLTVFKNVGTSVSKYKPNHSLLQQKTNEMSTFMLESVFNKQNISKQTNSTQDQGLINEFRYSKSEDYYRNVHLKNWLQSLTLTDQYNSCATSPTLTSLSTGSSTNLSSKWEESYCQFSYGSGTSSGYDAEGFITKANVNNSHRNFSAELDGEKTKYCKQGCGVGRNLADTDNGADTKIDLNNIMNYVKHRYNNYIS